MLKMILNFLLTSEVVWTIILIGVGFLLSFLLKRLKRLVEKTPNKIDDALFNFIVNDIFLKVEKDKIQKFVDSIPRLKNKDKIGKAVEIFKQVYKEQTGENADENIINQAKAVWSELALIYPSNAQNKQDN